MVDAGAVCMCVDASAVTVHADRSGADEGVGQSVSQSQSASRFRPRRAIAWARLLGLFNFLFFFFLSFILFSPPGLAIFLFLSPALSFFFLFPSSSRSVRCFNVCAEKLDPEEAARAPFANGITPSCRPTGMRNAISVISGR